MPPAAGTQRRNLVFLLGSNMTTSMGLGIALIAAPWLLLQEPGGASLVGTVSFVINLSIFAVMPWVGAIVDLFDRKRTLIILRISYVVCLILLLFISKYATLYHTILIAFFGLGSFLLVFDQAARNALVQEVFDPGQYQQVNAALESQHQFASVVTGGVIALFLGSVLLTQVLWINALLVLVSGLMLLPIKSNGSDVVLQNNDKFISLFTEGLKYALDNPRLTTLSLLSFTPYICVQTNNYLIPVLLTLLLSGSVAELATYEISFGSGAILVGFFAGRLGRRFSNLGVIHASMWAYSVLLFIQLAWPSLTTIVWFGFIAGFANSMIRTARNSWLMINVPRNVFGRLMSFLQALMLGGKAAGIGAIALTVTFAGPWAALGVLFVAQLAATITFFHAQRYWKLRQKVAI